MHSNLGLPPAEEKHGETDGEDDKASTPEGRRSDSHAGSVAKGGRASSLRAGRTSTTQAPAAEKKQGARDKSRDHSTPRTSSVSASDAKNAGQAAAVAPVAEVTDNK